ncbi:MAG: OmpH family outer membrane protein [Spirochaetes bacterium]|nr:OmpH family outer membrane protein [Spirochaetota bacterium]
MKNFKYLVLIMIILSLFSLNDLIAKKAEKLVKIGAVDLQKVFEKSPGKIIAEEQLEKTREKYDDQKKKKEEEIKDLTEKYDNKKFTLSDSEKEKAQLEIQKKTVELKEFILSSNKKLEEEEDKLLTPLIDDIKDVIRAVSIKYGYDIILDKSTYILFIDKEFDISNEVIDELKIKYKK